MLHAKLPGNRPAGSGEDFRRDFTIYGCGGNLGHLTWTIYTNFGSAFPRRLQIKFGFDWPSGFREDLLKSWTTDGRWRRTDRRTDCRIDECRLNGYTKRSPCEPMADN